MIKQYDSYINNINNDKTDIQGIKYNNNVHSAQMVCVLL